jgi:uncharacterized protein involved in propanediol utilization
VAKAAQTLTVRTPAAAEKKQTPLNNGAETPFAAMTRGAASAIATKWAHVGEVLQGGLDIDDRFGRLADPDIKATRFLIDLPCPGLTSTATIILKSGTGKIAVDPSYARKAEYAARIALRWAGFDRRMDVQILLKSEIPLRHGFGSSSTDSAAVVIAICRAAKVRLPTDSELCKLLVMAEHASNPCLDYPVAFAHRRGIILQNYSGWPAMAILGFSDLKNDGIDTLKFPPARYNRLQITQYGMLEQVARRAFDTKNTDVLGRVMTTSAELNEQYLPREHCGGMSALAAIAGLTGAAGIAVSHSGVAAALVWNAGTGVPGENIERARELLTERGYDFFIHWTLGL